MRAVLRILILMSVFTLLFLPAVWPPQLPSALGLSPRQVQGAPVELPSSQLRSTPTPFPGSCTTQTASATPDNLTAGTPVLIAGQGFWAGSSVTISFAGPSQKPTLTASADAQCRVSVSVPTAGDLPGSYRVTLQGPSAVLLGDGTLTLNTTYVVNAPTATSITTFVPTSTPTLLPTTTPGLGPTLTNTPILSSCQFPSATMVSERISPGQNATVIGRGFEPGSTVQITIDGPSVRFASTLSRPASGSCEVTESFSTTANETPGRYAVFLSGVSSTSGATINIQTEFEIRGGAAPSPTATRPPGVPPPTLVAPADGPPVPDELILAPVTIDQSLMVTGGSMVPMVGETTEYEHVMRITNAGMLGGGRQLRVANVDLETTTRSPGFGRMTFVLLAQGDTLVLRGSTEYSSDTRVVSTSSNMGQASVQGSTLVWEGRLSPGETLVLSANLQQTPTTAGVLNEPIRSQSVTATNQQGRPLAVRPPARPVLPPPQRLVQPPPPPIDPATGPRFFPDTGFSVVDDNIWLYFNRRGGPRTFGAPISRLMLLNGAWVQLFEKGMLQVFEDGRVTSVNLLEPPYLPYETFGDVALPPVDEQLIASAPDPAGSDFAPRAQEFVRGNAPEQFENLASRFYATFLGTVLFRDAFFDGRGDPNLVPGFNLEIWGLPTSRATLQAIGPEQFDPAVALLRFQRGLMIHNGRDGTTTAAPLGYYLRSVIMGNDSQPVLAEVAATSALWGQYAPGALDWVARPEELAETNLVLVFTREDDSGEPLLQTPPARAQLWLQVLAATPTFNDAGEPLWIATPGEWYRVLQQDGGWAQVVWENDPPDTAIWIELDSRVEPSIE